LLRKLKELWRTAGLIRTRRQPFVVFCPCGHKLTGTRRRRHKVVACPGCGKSVFVLAASAWPGALPAPSLAAGQSPVSPVSARKAAIAVRWWRLPLTAALATLAALAVAFWILLPHLGKPLSTYAEPTQPGLQTTTEAGRRALANGDFHLAARVLTSWSGGNAANPNSEERRGFEQLRRQADLLSHLHGNSLQEILLEAIPLRNEDEWSARFRTQHQGKAVAFDDMVGRDHSGRPELTGYRVHVGNEKARVALEDLRLLKWLPLEPPQRLLFGGRLSGLSRQDGGHWAFHFEPDSGVLLTDVGAVAACLGPLDADCLAVLKRQHQWLIDLVPTKDQQ
jgi:hypothetical protein